MLQEQTGHAFDISEEMATGNMFCGGGGAFDCVDEIVHVARVSGSFADLMGKFDVEAVIVARAEEFDDSA